MALNPKKMKVAELKSELESRNIQVSKGLKKADLIALLESAVADESGAELISGEDGDQPSEINESDIQTEDDSVVLTEDEPASGDAPEQEIQAEEESPQPEEIPEQQEEEPAEEMPADDAEPEEPAQEEEQMQVDAPPQEQIAETTNGPEEEMEPEQEEAPTAQEPDSTADETEPVASGEEEQKEETSEEQAAADSTTSEDKDGKEDGDKKEDDASEEQKDNKDDDRDRRRDRRDRDGRHDSHSRKRHHEDHDRHHRRYEDRYAPPPEEPEEEFDDALVVLDKYNSDLNMKLHRDRLTGQPLTLEGFAYLWAGARATYGVNKGKVCYECKLTEEHSVRHLSSNEPNRHLVRLGWSRNLSTMMAGEEELSYAYCGTGKKVTNETAEDYGETFKEGDVISSYIDFTGEENVTITFTKNGASLDVAFTIEKEKLGDEALFPHVLCKNTTVEFNFGQKETPYFPHPEGLEDYVFLAAIPLEDRIRGLVGATERKQCEVIMMCGLPGSGKTQYVDNLVTANPDKNYSVLGTNALMKRMKVSGLESKASRDSLMQNASNCLNRLFQVACRKKRNFILDQTNVYAAAQRRRMRSFEGFQRKAVIIVPSDEDFKSRVEKRLKEQGKDVPDHAVYEMKMNFTFPEEGDLFESVEYAELQKEEAEKVVDEYRTEAKKKGPPPEKRMRGGFDSRGPPMGGRGGGNWGNYDNRMMGGRPPFRGGGGGGYGGGGYGGGRNFGNQRSGGGYRDRGDNRRGGGGGGNWNKGGQGGGGGGNWGQNRNMGGGGGRGGGGYGGNRGGYGGNRSGGGGGGGSGFNRSNSGGGGANRPTQNRNMNMNMNQGKGNFNQNRTQGGPPRGGSGGGMGGPMGGGMGRGGGAQQGGNQFNYHQAYQQQAAQFSAQSQPQSYQQQAYNPQAQQPDYSQQWAQYYQHQAAAQQQQAAAAAAYQNYYAYQNAYANQAAQTKPQ